VYGNSSVIPKSEDMKPAPLSPYAVSKLAGEEYCKVFTAIYGLETVALRYFNVFGPRQDPTSQYSAVIPKFIEAISNAKPPLIYGDGEQSRDFTYVLNVAKANLLAVKIPDIAGEVFNIACGKRITVNALFETIGEFLNSDVRPIYNEPRQGDIRHSWASIEKAIKILHYAPEISFTEGIKKTIDFVVNSKSV
jgi:UDP-glucose 4-epimerase